MLSTHTVPPPLGTPALLGRSHSSPTGQVPLRSPSSMRGNEGTERISSFLGCAALTKQDLNPGRCCSAALSATVATVFQASSISADNPFLPADRLQNQASDSGVLGVLRRAPQAPQMSLGHSVREVAADPRSQPLFLVAPAPARDPSPTHVLGGFRRLSESSGTYWPSNQR